MVQTLQGTMDRTTVLDEDQKMLLCQKYQGEKATMAQFSDSVELILSVTNSEMNMIDINRTLYPIIDSFFLQKTFTKTEHIMEPHACLNKFKIIKIMSLFHHNRIKPVMNNRVKRISKYLHVRQHTSKYHH